MTSTFISELLASFSERRAGKARRSKGVTVLPAPPPALSDLCEALISRRGEASGVAIAVEILRRYRELDDRERQAFFLALAQDFGPNEAQLSKAVEDWRASNSAEALNEISQAAEPRRQEVIRRLNLAPGGTGALVRMREDLMRHLSSNPLLEVLDADFQHLFGSWFNRGFLTLRRIDWSTSARILERIIRYEAVHEIRDWDDLRRRIEPEDRRLFAFFHPQMSDDPLIFVEVALMDAIPSAIAPVLADARPAIHAEEARVAVFYSISNCHAGLKGVSFGNFLIKQVAQDLKRELPELKTFVTLSPVPGFASWLARDLKAEQPSLPLDCRRSLAGIDGYRDRAVSDVPAPMKTAIAVAAAHYFLKVKGRGNRPIDPVARFHLGNGARLERINAFGDRSEKGSRQSHGLMVNYLYDLASVEANHEAYAEKGEVAASPEVRVLLTQKLN